MTPGKSRVSPSYCSRLIDNDPAVFCVLAAGFQTKSAATKPNTMKPAAIDRTDIELAALAAAKEAITNKNPAAVLEVFLKGGEIGHAWEADGRSYDHLLTELEQENWGCNLSDIVCDWDGESCTCWAEEMGVKDAFLAYCKSEDVSYCEALRHSVVDAGKERALAVEWLEAGGVEGIVVQTLADILSEAIELLQLQEQD